MEQYENIGGGRKQNDYNNVMESRMIHEQNDPELKRLRYQKFIIKMMFDCLIKSHQDVLIDNYGNKKCWVTIGIDNHIDKGTAREWRGNFKDGIKGYLYTTFEVVATRFRTVYAPV
ncbi:RinA family protein [Weissella fangxianensis]|uniref:RinA family protein n=1 Tax=Weissella fangxianensis TaxID=2953879 RepID=UPI00215815DC|nr:RinA family protein [Weissella fangxianensis]